MVDGFDSVFEVKVVVAVVVLVPSNGGGVVNVRPTFFQYEKE